VSNLDTFVLDASAFLALFHREQGWEVVDDIFARDDVFVCMSTVNYAEALAKILAHEKNPASMLEIVQALGIRVMDFNLALAEETGALKPRTASLGLSLADCACLALARHLGATAVTADKAWARLGNSFDMRFIR